MLRAALALELRTDGPDLVRPLIDRLRLSGFSAPRLMLLSPEEAVEATIAVAADTDDSATADGAALVLAVAEFCAEEGIDPARYPLQRPAATGSGSGRVITLPVRACKERRRPAYAGAFPERFPVELLCDDRELGSCLEYRLRDAGFRASLHVLEDVAAGFSITHPMAAEHPDILGRLQELLAAVADIVTTDSTPFDLATARHEADRIVVTAPLGAAKSGTLAEALGSPARFDCEIHGADPAALKLLRGALDPLGFRSLRVRKGTPEPSIVYGAAPAFLIQRLRELVARVFAGVRLPVKRLLSRDDRRIGISLPEGLKGNEGAAPVATPRQAARRRPTTRRVDRPFLAAASDALWVGPHLLPLPQQAHPLAPPAAGFRSYVADQTTASTLAHLALSVVRGEPAMLEGETASSKTSAVLFLAQLLGQGVLRVNLHGQTDTAELIGRYMPQGRAWRWNDGAIPRAMTEGLWVILDEINLAGDPAVLERLNPVLEPQATLMLTEHDNRILGVGGTPVDAGFRIFATLNPAGGAYAGRVALSPAFKDRWIGYRQIPCPTEQDVHALLDFVVHGTGPEVVIDGATYPGQRIEHPPLAGLTAVPGVKALLEALARFHVGAEAACNAGEGKGGLQVDRAVISRRSLLAMLGAIASEAASDGKAIALALRGAVERYYLARATTPALAEALESLLAANGLHADGWSFA